MKLPELPPLPTYPKVPEFEARGLWNAWARAYAVTYGEAVREACARAVEALRDDHCAATQLGGDVDVSCDPSGSACDFVAAWNDAAAAIRRKEE